MTVRHSPKLRTSSAFVRNTKPTDAELVGQKFGRLTIGVRAPTLASNGSRRYQCRCDCGRETITTLDSLKSGKILSCGCFLAQQRRERLVTHGHARKLAITREYRSWTQMIVRCENDKHVAWSRYGGRGIKVCERWRTSFEAFLSDMGPRPLGKSLDRYPDKDGNYEPTNCRWATVAEQNRHKSNSKVTATIAITIRSRAASGESAASIARDLGLSPSHVSDIKNGRIWMP